jgi:hypothetical protein
MAASFLASFVIFTITGFYTVFRWMDLSQDPYVKVSLFAVVLLNALFYHYVAGYTEMDEEMKSALQAAPRLEWCLRVVNQSILFLLWFSLEHSFKAFFICLTLLYSSYVIWDLITWKLLTKHALVLVDCAGLALTFLFYLMYTFIYRGNFAPNTPQSGAVPSAPPGALYFYFGFICLFYLMLPFFGISRLKFNPFSAVFMKRPKLH